MAQIEEALIRHFVLKQFGNERLSDIGIEFIKQFVPIARVRDYRLFDRVEDYARFKQAYPDSIIDETTEDFAEWRNGLMIFYNG
jgi:hypothetical protein